MIDERTKKLKKFLCILATVALILAIVPVRVFAETNSDININEDTNQIETDDISEYAIFYTVTFYANNREYYKTMVQSGEKFKEIPADPVREGYVFCGWYANKDKQGEPIIWNFGKDIVCGNFSLYALWDRGNVESSSVPPVSSAPPVSSVPSVSSVPTVTSSVPSVSSTPMPSSSTPTSSIPNKNSSVSVPSNISTSSAITSENTSESTSASSSETSREIVPQTGANNILFVVYTVFAMSLAIAAFYIFSTKNKAE